MKKGRDIGILNKKEAKYLIPESTRIPVIYYLPKIHKRTEKPLGRSIISGMNSFFSRLGEYLDQFLKPLVLIINELQNVTGVANCLLATIDVSSLYTSIILKDGLKGVEKALHENTGLRQEQIGFILEGLKMTMKSNYFWFKKSYYVQTRDVTMGANYAPSVTNLFMNMWEEKCIYGKR